MTKSTPPTTLPGTHSTAPTTNGTPSSSIESLFTDLAQARATISTLQSTHSAETKTLTTEIAALVAKNKALRDATYSPLARYERRLQLETRWINFVCGTMACFFAALYAAYYLFGPSWWCACVWGFLYIVSCRIHTRSEFMLRKTTSLLWTDCGLDTAYRGDHAESTSKRLLQHALSLMVSYGYWYTWW
jgi:hypothetical protein